MYLPSVGSHLGLSGRTCDLLVSELFVYFAIQGYKHLAPGVGAS